MGWFDSPEERQRKDNLRLLEDKRVAFAKRLREMGLKSDRALYCQVGGGFHGIALCGNQFVYITGPAPGEDADFTASVHSGVSIQTEQVTVPSEGMGGILGFGKRGAQGYRLHLHFPDGTDGELELLSGMNCVYEHDKGTDLLFDAGRRRGDANFVWNFRPIEPRAVKALLQRWLTALGDAI
ncbi:hypothetical protein ACH6CV_08580 [Bacillota bacterium Meth-B3]|nr:hypothetical protein [Christensenellaceae bacterium]MEA5066601.1 hypothetical protein [Eubacteriales bacterium]MEA5067966.1 hypothetical protein [Christensenellaceae bacterium]